MIDIHCHILPGVDDGVKTMEDSIVMLRKAEAAGVTDMILTPHYIRGTVYNADNVRKWKIYRELNEKAKLAGLSVNLYLGNEIYIDEKLPNFLKSYTKETMTEEEQKNAYEVSTLNSTKYILIELPVQSEDRSAKSTLFTLIQKGFVPVIAHPERYHYVQKNECFFDDYIQMGCLLQGDFLALTGKYGKAAEKTLKKLLHEKKIFCLGSDVHKVSDSYKLDVVRKKLMKIFRDENKVTELLVLNPGIILKG